MITSLYVHFYRITNLRAQLEGTSWSLLARIQIKYHVLSSSPRARKRPSPPYLRKRPRCYIASGWIPLVKGIFCSESPTAARMKLFKEKGLRKNRSANVFMFHKKKRRGITRYDVVCLKLLLLTVHLKQT